MIRADVWEESHASSSDADFEEMLFRLYSPFEVNFEMLHMVHYVKRVVDPETFDAFGCSVLSAEFWLHELFPIPVDPEVFSVLPSSTSSQDMDISHGDVEEHSVEDRLETVASDDTQLPLPKKEHRPVPGFKTILQCGANTICDSSRIESSTRMPDIHFEVVSRRRPRPTLILIQKGPRWTWKESVHKESNHPSQEIIPSFIAAPIWNPLTPEQLEIEIHRERRAKRVLDDPNPFVAGVWPDREICGEVPIMICDLCTTNHALG
ncbi:unnamed protein product [Calicophoron daubneyi]|uniref:Uncharacterized protein n=1 Tax=Calicophoron daubneyi TaxID=300641 RepID=A0AAV2T7C7_CALDB